MRTEGVETRLRADGLYTQAGNFLSHVSTGVDPRTGQFTLACSLPGLQANDLAGPLISPSLHFSPLNSHSNSGFGLGWSMSFSQLDFATERLVINSGDSFKLDRDRSDFSRDGLLQFFDQKLCTFQVFADDDEGRRFRIEYKDGITEYLHVQDRSDTALLVEVCSAQGRRAYLEWVAANGPYLLSTVRDEQRALLSIQWARGEVRLVAFPASARAATFTLSLNNDQLTSLILPDSQNRWIFEYDVDENSGLLFPRRVLGPLGSIDEVTYAVGAAGHRLPLGAPLGYLPRVLNHRHDPGAGQPVIYKSYTWVGDYNFLGYLAEGAGDWQDGQDNLYRAERYEYTCLETSLDEKGAVLVTVERTWNRFHLQACETTTRGANAVRMVTTYGENPEVGWEDQPAWCQLPVATLVRYESGDAFREEHHRVSYDAFGNILNQHHADGRIEEHEYYPAGGAQGCPDDGSRFVRWLKRHTLIAPSPGAQAPAHTAYTDYTYSLLSKRHAQDRQFLVLACESAHELTEAVDTALGQTLQITQHAIDSPFHGLPIKSTTLINGYAYTTDFVRTRSDDTLSEVQRFTSHDGLTNESATVRCCRTGLTLSRQNVNGVVTQYEYDVLGRVVQRTDNPGNAYEVSSRCHYGWLSTQAIAEEVDTDGRMKRIVFDGDGRVVSEALQDPESVGAPQRDTLRVSYDSYGNAARHTTLDWYPDAVEPISTTSQSVTDDWGNVCLTVQPGGVQEHTHYDPIQQVRVSWLSSAAGELGPETTVRYNQAGAVISVELHMPRSSDGCEGQWQKTEAWELDALQRPVAYRFSGVDGLSLTTRTRYDSFGRVSRRVLEDGNVIEWTYAAHTDGESVTKVTLWVHGVPTVVGEQTFDGQSRPITRKCGEQQETLLYRLAQIPPAALQRADGRQTLYTYERLLNDQLKGTHLPDTGMRGTYTYSSPHARITQAEGNLGRLRWDYTQTGRLLAEHWEVGAEVHTSSWSRTLGGRLLVFKDTHGEQQNDRYDALGRLRARTTNSLELEIEYDAFGRVSQTITSDLQTLRAQQQTLRYDALGREESRQWLCRSETGESSFRQLLTWNTRDQISTRRWEAINVQDVELLREERYDYDERGRLVHTRSHGPENVIDPRTGLAISHQSFRFNALNGYEQVDTEYEGGQRNGMCFFYDVSSAADRPVRITHSWPQHMTITLEYDACGRLISERHEGQPWRRLAWDEQGHLTRREDATGTCDYQYDPLGRLVQTSTDQRVTRRFYDGSLVVNEDAGEQSTRLLRSGPSLFAQSTLSNAVREVVLTACDGQGSVRIETARDNVLINYTAHGLDSGNAQSRIGYAGEYRDTHSTLYMPGSNRPYDPQLMMFLGPDSESPFGAGGLNRYVYCAGDPVNRIDPDGHSFWSWVGVAVGIVVGAVAIVATAGLLAGPVAVAMGGAMVGGGVVSTAVAAGLVTGATIAVLASAAGAMAVTSAALEAISMGAGVAEAALEEAGNDSAARLLGWVSMGTGIAAGATSSLASTSRTASKLNRLAGRWRDRMLGNADSVLRTPAHFSPVPAKVNLSLRNGAPAKWHSVTQQGAAGTHYVFGASTAITGSDLAEPVGILERTATLTKRKVVLVTGGHGEKSGENWTNAGRRIDRLTEPMFLKRDTISYGGRTINGRSVEIRDVMEMDDVSFGKLVSNQDSHVILAYCFGRNDEALRYYRKLEPVTSYVKQLDLPKSFTLD